ncbi:C45 family autoproteolytic acyltransferase/hydolase [Virgibacillus siamensis]|uniref:C45 family autoproteolytic acyltransferase/hydolase n=1 Tax=Virgibacillus siamensis TaxID=480071 RepID=A0ABN1GA42_9BACI
MSDFIVHIFQHRGNAGEIGFELGNKIAGTPIMKMFDGITRQEIDTKEMEQIYQSIAPHLLEELYGVAEGAKLSRLKAAALFSGYDVPRPQALGCTAMMTNTFYVRNYDFSPDLYDGYFSLIQPDEAFATAGYNLQVLGRHDGVNQHGLVIGLHFVSNTGYTTGISAWMAVRMVLDTCTTADEAINLLREIPHAACYNFSMSDTFGNIVVVEASPEKVIVRRHEEFLTCVNHFQDESMQKQNRLEIDNSLHRQAHLGGMERELLSQRGAFNYFRDQNSPLFYEDYAGLFGTLHTFSYERENSRILTAIAKSEHVLDFHFDRWISGENINKHRLEGIIENG